MAFSICRKATATIIVAVSLVFAAEARAQNYERYKPLDIPPPPATAEQLPEPGDLPPAVEDDRVLVESLDSVVIVDQGDKISKAASIDSLEGIHYAFNERDSLVYKSQIRAIIEQQLGKPITLRRINQLSRDIIAHYRKCKQPIVDVLIPEQRITGGTLHLLIVESRIGAVRVEPGRYFNCHELSRWVECAQVGQRIYEPNIESDLFWLNQNPSRRVSVDFKKGSQPATTDVIYKVQDISPLRGYIGMDDSGVRTLNYGRFFSGFQYGNLLGRGGTLGYQYTADQDFSLLEAHSLNYAQQVDRTYSFLTYASWAGVSPRIGQGLTQDGESHQFGSRLTRNLIFNRLQQRSIAIGYDYKSTNNNLEFAGSTISNSNADLFEFRLNFHDLKRRDIDQYSLIDCNVFVGPGGGITGQSSAADFSTIRPGTSPDFIYGRVYGERADLIAESWLLATRFTGQAASERLLFSETLGLGGFDSVRGMDQRSYNADNGMIGNIEFGPKTYRWGTGHNTKIMRCFTFVDLGNGYLNNPRPGEDAYTFAVSTGVGTRYQLSDRVIARFDYGAALKDIDGVSRHDRAHFSITWIPGKRF